MSGFENILTHHPYLGVLTGVLLSISLPILRALLPPPPATAKGGAAGAAIWAELRPFVVVALFSALTAILVLAFAGDAVDKWQWYQALLAGYAWDSTLQKVNKQN